MVIAFIFFNIAKTKNIFYRIIATSTNNFDLSYLFFILSQLNLMNYYG